MALTTQISKYFVYMDGEVSCPKIEAICDELEDEIEVPALVKRHFTEMCDTLTTEGLSNAKVLLSSHSF